jgi:hypothetical protein
MSRVSRDSQQIQQIQELDRHNVNTCKLLTYVAFEVIILRNKLKLG